MTVDAVAGSDGAGAEPVVPVVGVSHHLVRTRLGIRIRTGEIFKRRIVISGLGVLVHLDESVRVSLPGEEGEEGLGLQRDRHRRCRDQDVAARGFGGVQHVSGALDVDFEIDGQGGRAAVACLDVCGGVEDREREICDLRWPGK